MDSVVVILAASVGLFVDWSSGSSVFREARLEAGTTNLSPDAEP